MSQDLNIALLQSDLHWEDPEKNLAMFSEQMEGIDADLVVLPEMFTTGFSMNTQLAEHSASALDWMKQQASSHSAVICGSVITEDGGKYYNRFHWVRPSGQVEVYDKRHLFRFAGEDEHYHPGSSRLIVEFNGWRICPLVCYDLRFPVWSRNAPLDGGDETSVYDLLIYVANWPEARRSAWRDLLRARAHENQCFVAGVNRVGTDGKGISYSGDSALLSPKGSDVCTTAEKTPTTLISSLSMSELTAFRQKFPVGRDRDRFHLD